MIIFTDSSSELTDGYLRENDLKSLNLSFTIEGRSYQSLEAAGMTAPQFYGFLRGGGMASTSQLNAQEYVEAFRPTISSGQDLVYIGLSGGLSSSYENAVKAAEKLKKDFPDNTAYICDTRMASMGVALVVKHAMLFRAAGKTCRDFYLWHKENKYNFNALFTVDDLNFLRRGGRLKNSAAVLGTLLKIKPVLNMDDEGHLVAQERVRGRRASLQTMVDRLKGLVATYDQPMCVSHGDAAEDCEFVAAQLRALGVKDILTGYIGPVIGAHSGPGTVALFFMGKGSAYVKR